MKTAKTLSKINLGKKSKVQEKGLEEEISVSTKISYFSVLFKDCLNVYRVLYVNIRFIEKLLCVSFTTQNKIQNFQNFT